MGLGWGLGDAGGLWKPMGSYRRQLKTERSAPRCFNDLLLGVANRARGWMMGTKHGLWKINVVGYSTAVRITDWIQEWVDEELRTQLCSLS